MRYKRTFTKYEECMMKLKDGFSIMPDFKEYLNIKEMLLFATLVEFCQKTSVGKKHITFDYVDCTKSNKEIAEEMNWSLTTVIKWSNQLEKLGFITTERKSHVLIRRINVKLIYETQNKIGPVLLYHARILRNVCGDKSIAEITDDDIKETNRRLALIGKGCQRKAKKIFGNISDSKH